MENRSRPWANSFLAALFLLLTLPSARAVDYVIHKIKKEFRVLEGGGLISADCPVSGVLKCRAQQALEKKWPPFPVSPHAISLGQDPGAIFCAHMGAKVVKGRQEYKEMSFCQFDDLSLLDTGSLHALIKVKVTE